MKLGTKTLLWLAVGFLSATTAHGTMVVTPWIPIFKGIDRAVGTNYPDAAIPRLQVVQCVRIDLTDPDVQFLPSPRAPNYNPSGVETVAYSVSNYMRLHGCQVVANCNFHSAPDTGPEGANGSVKGLLLCTNQIVSAVGDSRYASLFFTSNKEPIVAFNNVPPGLSTTGIYAAVTGYYPVLSNGVNFADAAEISYPGGPHDPNPRTAFGVSQDKRYLFILIIDGRQSSYSEGAIDSETAAWLLQFGAWDGMNMDGGGSTAMYMMDCLGNPAPLGHSSFVKGYGRERVIGAHFGVYAAPLPSVVYNVAAIPGTTSATITWNTTTDATSQVEYGLTPAYGILSPLNATPVTEHGVTLNGLTPGAKYYYRVLSLVGANQYSSSCAANFFSTTNVGVGLLVVLTNTWRFSTNNLDGANWPSPAYDDSGWTNQGRGALWADSRSTVPSSSTNTIPNFAVGTRMPINQAIGYPFSTYYFRSRFVFSGNPSGVTLTFSNYFDDGAVFYLNGVEVFRTNVAAAPTSITNGSFALATPCSGDANCPVVFKVSGSLATNLWTGTNVVAVEIHNYRSGTTPSPDVTFESAVFSTSPPPPPNIISNVVAEAGETNATITWTTATNATTEVLYGVTPALPNSSGADNTPVSAHHVTLSGLQPVTTYFFRVLSSANGNSFSMDGTFTTTSLFVPLVDQDNVWKYNIKNLDGVNWTTKRYNDAGWPGEGKPLLYIEDNTSVQTRTTALPADANGLPYPTYYFRTHFTVPGPVAGLSLLFSNLIDDGAVFYLNGVEIQRLRMPAGRIDYTTKATACPYDCEATLDVPDFFRVGEVARTNLIVGGDNVLAAEVHQYEPDSPDIVFGSTMALVRARAEETRLRISRTNNTACLVWDGPFLTLQQASAVNGATWSDVPLPANASMYCVTNLTGPVFYRLKN